MDHENLMQRLRDGNRRFRNATPQASLSKHLCGQKPHAAVLCCSDSRVPPEIIFNAGIGELFVVRVAGNVALGETVMASLDYAVQHLEVPMLMVLGHTCCGAVKATLEGGDCAIFDEIRECCSEGCDMVDANIMRQVSMLPQRSQAIRSAVEERRLMLVGARYNMEDGSIAFLGA